MSPKSWKNIFHLHESLLFLITNAVCCPTFWKYKNKKDCLSNVITLFWSCEPWTANEKWKFGDLKGAFLRFSFSEIISVSPWQIQRIHRRLNINLRPFWCYKIHIFYVSSRGIITFIHLDLNSLFFLRKNGERITGLIYNIMKKSFERMAQSELVISLCLSSTLGQEYLSFHPKQTNVLRKIFLDEKKRIIQIWKNFKNSKFWFSKWNGLVAELKKKFWFLFYESQKKYFTVFTIVSYSWKI